ncbi:Fic family protein [Pseudobutyrivibrio sp.]|uniref:Fic family protein n=1 Tax=Pseudobutyrivibrio sp. TaxID=2014367 RepID=UPI001B6AF62C|nr:Fic family protein [Pseudobutyrivibrio sp.]MBP3261738.1 Fic family protein [Pseudobutyrivibrio sp.]MBP3727905.1 Fic family protein [Pseudobutyrivibrio sp.]
MRYEDILVKWKDAKGETMDDLLSLLESYQIIYAYNSGKIENDSITYHDTREIFDKDGVVSYTGDLRTLYEMQNSKDAWKYLLEALQQKMPLNEELLKRFQKLLTKNTYDERRWITGERPGEYKKKDYVTGEKEVGTLPEWVHEEVLELLEELEDVEDSKALIVAAYFHAKFENIHAFADGNGRVGRLCMNYILLIHNHPPITIFEEDKKEYYKALEAWDDRQSLKELTDFLKNQTEKTWSTVFDRGQRREKSRGLKDYI